jgi:plasmid maintenance system antidote protein VapI
MTQQWITREEARSEPVDFEVLQESALALAQVTLQQAINDRCIGKSELAKKMGRHRSFVTRMMRGDHNMTIKTYALALAACGYRPKFGYSPLTWGWSATESNVTISTYHHHAVPAGAGTFMLAA